MTILVTGGLGGIGSRVVESFAADGHDVVCLDRHRPQQGRENVTFLAADVTDQGQAWEIVATHDPDAVVHCAGIPKMGVASGGETFETNVTSAYHVFEAAGRVGADVVWTSSESLYGMSYADPPFLPDYLPVDEAHPKRPEDPYGISKLAGERVAERTARAYDVSVTSIRPGWVSYPGGDQQAQIREGFDPETADRMGNLWTHTDVRDVVSIIGAALDADIDGHEAFLAVAETNYLGLPTADTIETVYGALPDECALEGEQAVFSNQKAKAMLDWEPDHTWRTAEREEPQVPSFC
jgi:nucleoside-diphosphate-sugar epimerase